MTLFAKKIIGIDFHDYYAQLVELKSANGKVSLEAYNRVTIPPNVIKDGEIVDQEMVKALLLNLLKNANPKPIKTKSVACIFPAKKIFTHIFKFPLALTEEEIKKAIPYEAETVIPFSIQDVYWDFHVLFKDLRQQKHASQYVLFACVPKTMADQYVQLLDAMDLAPFLCGIMPESLINAFAKQIDSHKTTLIIDRGTLTTNYVIVQNNTIQYTFSATESGHGLISGLAKEFYEDEATILLQREKNNLDGRYTPGIKAFLARTYKIAQEILKDFKTPVSDIILTGEFLYFPKFLEEARAAFPDQEVHIGNPKYGLEIPKNQFENATQKQEDLVPYSLYFTHAIGVALRGLLGKGNGGINLLPDALRENFANRRHAFLLAFAGIGMTMLSLFSATVLFLTQQNLVYERQNLAIKKGAIDKIIYGTRYQEITTLIKDFNGEVGTLSTIQNSLFSVPTLFENVIALLPEGVRLTFLMLNDENLSIEMSGVADDRAVLLATQQNFEQAEFVSSVVAPISNYDAKTNISFTLSITLLSSALTPYGTISNS